MMEQDLQSSEINHIDNFSCLVKGECSCRMVISELHRISISIYELQGKIETQGNQQSYTSACLATLGFPIDEQSLKDHQDYSCGNHYNS